MELLQTIAIWAGSAYGFLLFCWVLYVAAMNYKRVEPQLGKAARFHGRVVWFIAQPLDFVLNMVMSVFLLDFPRELILSPKLKRLKREGGWRGAFATWTCRELLNPFDPDGSHC